MTDTTIERATEVLLRERRPAWPLAIMRVAFGIVLLAWTITMAFDVTDLLGTDALVPPEFATFGGWTFIRPDTTGEIWFVLSVLVVASIAITIGWRPTGWLIVAFLLLVAVQQRNTMLINSGDLLLRNLALLLALTPTGAALSVDRRRTHGRDALRTAPLVAPWGMRLIQLQVMTVYFFAFWSKSGETWINGTAVSTVFRLDDLERFAAPGWLVENVIIVALLTWGALAIELALALLLWVKRLRPLLIVLGVLLHLLIDVFVLVGFFGPLMMIGLLSFVDADWLEARVRSADVA